MTNQDRAKQGMRLLDIMDEMDTDPTNFSAGLEVNLIAAATGRLEENLIDALTNLRHLVKRAGLDFDKANEIARSHFLFEDECELMGVSEDGLWWE